MSMNAVFVQVEAAELTRFRADPSLVEPHFHDGAGAVGGTPGLDALTNGMQRLLRSHGAQNAAEILARLPPELRRQVEERLGGTASGFASGAGGDDMSKSKAEDQGRARGGTASSEVPRARLSLDKDWHGVHFVLCGKAEPGKELLSQAVLGGEPLGDDDEGFSGYGPGRCFTAEQVTALSRALSHPEVENDAAGRFDAVRMSALGIYPGWKSSDATEVMGGVRKLRDFYADAARKGHAIVSCLI